MNISSTLFQNVYRFSNLIGMFRECTSLVSIPSGLFANIFNYTGTGSVDFSYVFYGCRSLRDLPSDMFYHAQRIYITRYAFAECTSLESIPVGFLTDCLTMAYMEHMFENCASLMSIPAREDFMPPGIWMTNPSFTGYGTYIDWLTPDSSSNQHWVYRTFHYMFNGCSGIIGNVPILWRGFSYGSNGWPGGEGGSTAGTGCFRGCTNAANYDEIPDSWK